MEVFNHKVGRIQNIEWAGVALAKTVIADQQVSATTRCWGASASVTASKAMQRDLESLPLVHLTLMFPDF
ncbi:MAG: hypothetical protein EAZ42_12655 [Verrucomicrobia bacterium]|nr:MAG: hypothetical protein EAZ42_12655 [Verrucomicrobiota bacterium]